MSPKRLFVIDAMAMAFRNFHAFGARPLTTSSGLPVSAVYGSLVYLMKLIEEQKPDYLLIATDSKEPTFRHELYKDYKANRTEMPPDLAVQLPYLFRLFEAMGIHTLQESGVEADDLIGTVAKRFSGPDLHCYIVSGDKDFMQLVNDHVFLFTPKKGGENVTISYDGVKEKFGCRPDQVVDVLALIGDTSDNVPGVPGIGEKGAAKLIDQFGTLRDIFLRIDEVKNDRLRENLRSNHDLALLSKKLVTLHTDCTLTHALEEFSFDPQRSLVSDELLSFVTELEFTSQIKRINELRKKTQSNNAQAKSAIPMTAPASDTAVQKIIGEKQLLDALQKMTRCGDSGFVFDTETTGLDIIADRPIGMSVCLPNEETFYIPFVPDHGQTISEARICELLRPVFADVGIKKIAHNLKYDLQMLHNSGIKVLGTHEDTMIAGWVVDSSKRSYSLDSLGETEIGMRKIPIETLLGTDKVGSMLDVPLGPLASYACHDALMTFKLHKHFAPQLRANGLEKLYREVEMPLVEVLATMERNGIYLDTERLARFSDELAGMVARLETQIFNEAGGTFNINSTKQLQEILFEKLKVQEKVGLKRIKKTKTGYSTDSSVLESMSEHPLPAAILEYRTVTKLKNTYVDTLPQLVNQKTGRIHTSFHQTGTATGRLSSSDPNLQNIPIRTTLGKQIRAAFRAQQPQGSLISADYSQIELRLLAHMANEEVLIDAFRNGQDIHRATAAKIFGIAERDVDATLRSRAKAINFGIIYGMGPMRLARETGVSIGEAKEFIEKYFKGFPKIRDFIDSSIQTADDLGYSRTIMGRMRRIPELKSDNPGIRNNAENMAVNSPVQGSAADLIKMAMVQIHKDLANGSGNIKLLLQVHDELVFESSAPHDDEAIKSLRSSMEHAMTLRAPLKVEVGEAANWLEAH